MDEKQAITIESPTDRHQVSLEGNVQHTICISTVTQRCVLRRLCWFLVLLKALFMLVETFIAIE